MKTITVKKDGAPPETAEQTLAVAGSAVAYLTTLEAGDKVKLVLTKDIATSKESVTSIEKTEDGQAVARGLPSGAGARKADRQSSQLSGATARVA